MTETVVASAGKNGLLHRLMAHIAKSATPAEIADMLADAPVVKGEAMASPLSEPIDDLWTASKETWVPAKEELEVGGGTAAKGNEPSKMISTYSPAQAPQMGISEDAIKLGEIVNGLMTVRKAVQDMQGEHALMKSLLIKLVKSDMPQEKAEEKESKEDKDGDKEYAKAVTDMVAAAEPLVAKAKTHLETAKSMTAEGFASHAATARFNAAEQIIKARKLVEAAKAMDPTNAKVIAIAKAMDDMKDEFGNKEEDKEKETAKAAPVVAFAPEHVTLITSALEGLQIQKSTISELMDKLAGRPMEVAKGKPELPIASQTAGLEGLQALIRQKEDAGALTPAEAAVAMDLSVLREADIKGLAPKGIYDAKRAIMPAAVREIFANAA